MVPSVTRRKHLIGAGAILAGAPLAIKAREALYGGHRGFPYETRVDAAFKTDEPVVSGTDVSTDPSQPDSYVALIRTREEAERRYRVDYLQEAYDTDVSKLYTVDYDTEFIAVVGRVLPKKDRLDLTGQTYGGGTLETTHEVTEYSGLEVPKVHHNAIVYRQRGHEPPENLDVEFVAN